MDNIDQKIQEIINKELVCFRVDIKNSGTEANAIIVQSADDCKITTPTWFKNNYGTGITVSGNNRKQLLKIKMVQEGTLNVFFRGPDKKYNNERIPIWVDYKSIKINGKEIISAPITTWHDQPYKYKMQISDKQEVTIEFELKYHVYRDDELKSILQKLFSNNKDIQDNIDTTVRSIQKATILPKIVAITGYYYSGSSALVGFFHECNNTTVMGNCEKVYSHKTQSSCEVTFFTHTNFFNFIDAFYLDSFLEKDLVIKKFINDIYRSYDNKGARSEKNPNFFTDKFLQISLDFIINVIDLDEYTINFMKDKRFPIKWNSTDEIFQNCTFMQGKGISQYILYKFKKMLPEEFEKNVAQYVNQIFKLMDSEEYLVCDQLLKRNTEKYSLVDKLNSYMIGVPIKEICVYRDPRDRFLSAFRNDISWLSRDVDKYTASYKSRLVGKNSISSPNRLMIRFEDMVLKYEETTKKIMDFIGMDPSHHVAPKSVFDPALSVVNIGAYKQFVDQDFMRQIEERMPEYCYYPEKENLSQEALDLLKGTENA